MSISKRIFYACAIATIVMMIMTISDAFLKIGYSEVLDSSFFLITLFFISFFVAPYVEKYFP